MKKQFIYMGAWLLATTFAACNEDYTDWASPQSNPQEEATAEVTATFEAGKDAAIVVDNLTSDSVEIAQITNLVAKEGSTLRVSKLTINGDHSIPYTLVGNVVKVHAADLDSLTETTYQSRRSVPRALTLTMDAAAVSPDGEAFRLTGSDVNITLTPPTLPAIDPNGYYLIGSFNDWKSNNLLSFTQDATDPTLYTLETSFSTADTEFKVLSASAVGSDGTINWKKMNLGSTVQDDKSGAGLLEWNDSGNLIYPGTGKVKITIDLTNYTFTVKDDSAPTELYMTGSAYGWGSTWNQLVPVNGVKGAFWGMFYCNAGDQIKFAPQADWGGDFGYTGSTISQESIDRAGLTNPDDSGNVGIGNAGWYIIYVSAVGDDKQIEFYPPTVYLTGECAVGGWNPQFGAGTEFSVPSDGTGSFVSPAFVADGKVRICVVLPGNDWWKSEFNVFGGQIVYRGNGGDQAEVLGTTGQTVSLNFADGTGSIQ